MGVMHWLAEEASSASLPLMPWRKAGRRPSRRAIRAFTARGSRERPPRRQAALPGPGLRRPGSASRRGGWSSPAASGPLPPRLGEAPSTLNVTVGPTRRAPTQPFPSKALPCSVQFSRVRLFATPWTAAHQASLSHHQLPELAQTHVH